MEPTTTGCLEGNFPGREIVVLSLCQRPGSAVLTFLVSSLFLLRIKKERLMSSFKNVLLLHFCLLENNFERIYTYKYICI